MRCWTSVCCGMLLLGTMNSAWATESAAESFGKSANAGGKPLSARQRAIAEFDTDGDGKLSDAERRAARMALAKKKRSALSAEDGGSTRPNSTSFAGSDPGYPSSGINPYAIGAPGYGSANPYLLGTSASGGYYYYGSGVFNQMTPGQPGSGGGCMSTGASGGRR